VASLASSFDFVAEYIENSVAAAAAPTSFDSAVDDYP